MGVGTIELASHPISAFDDVSETFITIAMLKAPLIGIPDRQVRIRGLIRTHLKQFSEIDHGEKERFIEGITDLFSSRMTTDRINEISMSFPLDKPAQSEEYRFIHDTGRKNIHALPR